MEQITGELTIAQTGGSELDSVDCGPLWAHEIKYLLKGSQSAKWFLVASQKTAIFVALLCLSGCGTFIAYYDVNEPQSTNAIQGTNVFAVKALLYDDAGRWRAGRSCLDLLGWFYREATLKTLIPLSISLSRNTSIRKLAIRPNQVLEWRLRKTASRVPGGEKTVQKALRFAEIRLLSKDEVTLSGMRSQSLWVPFTEFEIYCLNAVDGRNPDVTQAVYEQGCTKGYLYETINENDEEAKKADPIVECSRYRWTTSYDLNLSKTHKVACGFKVGWSMVKHTEAGSARDQEGGFLFTRNQERKFSTGCTNEEVQMSIAFPEGVSGLTRSVVYVRQWSDEKLLSIRPQRHVTKTIVHEP